MDAGVRKEIESLRGQTAKQLRARYAELFGEETRSGNPMHLLRRVAWRLQANAEGELSERARQRAAELSADAELRRRAPRQFWRLPESNIHAKADPGMRRKIAGTRNV